MKDLRSIDFDTRICAVIGNPVSHSLSPAIHNAGYAELGLNFIYMPCQVEDVEGMLNGMLTTVFIGLRPQWLITFDDDSYLKR